MAKKEARNDDFDAFILILTGINYPGAEIGRQAWLRAMCPQGRAGSTPVRGTKSE